MSKVLNILEDHPPTDREEYEAHVWYSVNVVVEALENNDVDPDDMIRILNALQKEREKL